MIAQGTWAQPEYITDVMVIGCDKQEDVNAKWDAYVAQGWTGIYQDLNCAAGGKWINLYYAKEDNSPVRINSISFDGNSANAVGENGGRITGGHAYGGGGIYCEAGSKLTFNGGTITGNTVTPFYARK